VQVGADAVLVRGTGLRNAAAPDEPIDVGNAGTLMRLLPGWLAAQEGRTYSFFQGRPNSAGNPFWRFWKFPDKDRLELTKDEPGADEVEDKYNRAATYYLTAERLQAHGAPGRVELYKRFLEVFARGLKLSGENCVRVEIPYGDAHIAGLYTRAEGVDGPAPILVQLNGLDSTKEMKYRVGLPAWLAKRGVSSLVIDQPGTGEALRLHGMHAVYDSERWASKVVDWLETRADVDARRIGLIGWSNGGSTVLSASNLHHHDVAAAIVKPAFAIAFYPGCESDLKRGYSPAAPLPGSRTWASPLPSLSR